MRLELAIDVVYINDQSFLHSVDRRIKFKGISHLGTQQKDQNYTKESLCSGIENILRHYNKNDIYVTTIHTDNEFRSVMKMLEDKWEVHLNFCLPGEHVPDIEWQNRVLQEQFRVVMHHFPFKVIPRTMIVRLAL